MTSLLSTFESRLGDWLTALAQHLQLSLLTLLLAILLALPLAIFLSPHRKIAELILQIAGVFQTIPSLAILGLLIPIMGIGTLPALTALVIYALFPILQNTLTGLAGIDPSLKEAGIAFGMNRWERLKKFELPLAMPVIMSGIRTAAVMIIGTATLAALIGAGGLGSFILLGIDRHNSSLILIGAISSAILAIGFNFLLKFLEKARPRTIFASFGVLVLGLFLSYAPAIFPKMQAKETITVAGKLGPEPEILINMYKILIEQDSDLQVELKPNFGKTTFLYEALKSGKIDLYPEFTGTVTSSLLQSSPVVSNDAQQVYEAARDGILQQDKLVLLKPMAYQNTYALVLPRKIAEQYGVKSISDLAGLESQLKAGFTLEFNDREDGNKGLQSIYGLNLQVSTMEPALRYQAISLGDIQLTDAYSTDPEITQYDLQVLKDDKELFPPYQGAPLLSQSLLKKHPELKKILNQLAGKISEADMSQMNYQVGVEGKSAAEVARNYLEKENLIKK
ncbi:ABC transporter permease/substrate-binding protein [Streptococcus sp. 20-1249]|uniref:ABC transporter permease/substrate-binding protein n=1 Tax=Streptococcus hepaticus TaxID=3349163 RepID=UPI003749BD70